MAEDWDVTYNQKLLICAGIEKYEICIAVGIILSAALQIPCIVIRFFNKYHSC